MSARKTAVSLWLLWIGGLLVTLVAPRVLPERYYRDAETIREILNDRWPEGADSFLATAQAYELLGFPSIWPDALVGPIGFTIAFASVAFGARLAGAPWRPLVFLALASWTLPMAIFFGQYSKEVFAIVVVAAILRASTSARGVLLGAAFALVYAATVRQYWAIIVALWLTMLFGWRAGMRWPAMLALAAAALLPMSWASEYVFGMYLSDGRTVIVTDPSYVQFEAATTFYNPLPNTSPFTDLANTISGWLTLILPFYLVAFGGVQHVAFALFQFMNTVWFAIAARRLPPPDADRYDRPRAWQLAAAATWCVAYTIVQGMFEPDFGSFVKHVSNLLPMLMYLLAYRGETGWASPPQREVAWRA